MTAAPDDAPEYIYNLCRAVDWEAAKRKGVYEGSADDRRDGFIHFSTGAQVAESAAKHRAVQADILLLTVPVKALGPELAWEPSRGGSRGGELFPHLYGPLPVDAVERVDELPLTAEGKHIFPAHVREGRG
jgi:uncharacterized protein (DUF952 family)